MTFHSVANVRAFWWGCCVLMAAAWTVRPASSSFVHEGAPYLIDVWEAESKLPSNYVISIGQTQDGYLWLGTLAGLVRFDGVHFTVFDETTTTGLTTSRIVYLFEDSLKRLWIGTEGAGVVLAEQGRLTSLPIGVGGRSRLASVCEDRQHAVWLYTVDGQLWRYREGKAERFETGGTEDFFSQLRTVITDDAGQIWVGVDWGQFAFDPVAVTSSTELPVGFVVRAASLSGLLPSRKGGYWRLAANQPNESPRVQKWMGDHLERDLSPFAWERAKVSALAEDLDGNLIVGTLGAGVFWFNAQGRATTISTTNGLSSDYVLSLHVDPEGTIWVGTDGGGLNRIKRQAPFAVLEQTRGWAVQSVSQDSSGGLWIGSIQNGLNYWKDETMTRDPDIFGVLTVLVDKSDQIWSGTLPNPRAGALVTLDGVLVHRGPEDKVFGRASGPEAIQRIVRAIFQDRRGQLWFGSDKGLVRWDGQQWRLFTAKDGLASDEVHAIADDADGNLWVATIGGNLNRLRDDKITVFDRDEGLPGGDVSALFFDSDGTLWVGTAGRGLVRFQEGRGVQFTTSDGLVSNFIRYLSEDASGFLWVGSNQGVMRIEKGALSQFVSGPDRLIPLRVYGASDGLPTPECSGGSQPAICRATNGVLWFPTSKGLAFIDPAQLKPNLRPPSIVIESVLVDGQRQGTNTIRPTTLTELVIPAGKQRLEINYTSLNLSAPERARFRYRLEGHEREWVETGGLVRQAAYPRLPPGHYTFQVTAANEDGVWNAEGCSLKVTVEPPFWRTTWFLVLLAMVTLGLLVGVVYFFSTQKLQRQLAQLKQQEALEKERARIARDIHDQVGASLTQVALLGELVESDKDSPTEIEAHAQQISRTARETTRALDEIVWTVNPSNDTLEGLVNYVCKYAQDYLGVAGLRYRLDVPPALPSAVLPPDVRHNVFLVCKEAITNVVRHAHATAAHVRLRLAPSSFTIEIQDDGRGPEGVNSERAKTRHGLSNMRKRMEDVGGEFSIAPAPEGGTIVRLTAPLSG